MSSFLNWILGRKEEVVEEPVTYLDQQLHFCDLFGQSIRQHLQELTPAQRQTAERLIPALMELGINSHPPQDFSLFFQLTNWPRHQQEFRQLIRTWWQILQRCSSPSLSIQQTEKACCPINQNNLPAARAIVWLQLQLQGAAMVPELLSMMDDCVQQYPHCSEIAEQLALSSANALVRTPFYRLHQYDIALNHPALTRGRLGGRLQPQQMKQAS